MECEYENCTRPQGATSDRYCAMHRYRSKAGRSMDKPRQLRGLSTAARFWQHVDVGEPDECWPWRARCGRGGYGQFVLLPPEFPKKRTVVASRVAFMLVNGSEPENLALHRCDNPPCCNPSHIYDGTHSRNTRDMVERGRDAWATGVSRPLRPQFGEDNVNAKLTEQIVREIRQRYADGGVSQQQLASEYGVNQTKISAVVCRRTWKHVD